MSTTAFNFHATKPPKPDVYTTRRNQSKYLTLRYWDGERWFSLDFGGSRGAKPFKWPKNSISRRTWVCVKYKDSMCLRNISDSQATAIEWGEPYRVYDRSEVIAHLIKTGVLPKNWETETQAHMREAGVK